jgi:hypothetical protein
MESNHRFHSGVSGFELNLLVSKNKIMAAKPSDLATPKNDGDDNNDEDGVDDDDDGEQQRRTSYRGGPVESVCGWNVFVSGLHPTVSGTCSATCRAIAHFMCRTTFPEEDINESFSDVKGGNMNLARVNFDRTTGECKGYGLVEYGTRAAGQDAINRLHGKEIKGQKIGVHWAFVKPQAQSKDKST